MHKITMSIALICSLQACAQSTEQQDNNLNSEQYASMDSSQLHQKIEEMIADKSCQQTSDCALLAVGTKPCGGPDLYLAYAPKQVDDQQALQMLTQTHKQKVQDYFVENQIMGICVVTPQPSLACQHNQCVALEQNLQIQ